MPPYGMALAFETFAHFKPFGAESDAAALLKADRSIASRKYPFLLPGGLVKTCRDGFPIQQGQLQRWTKGRFVPVGLIWTSKRN